MPTSPERYVDPYFTLGYFARRSLVVCPRCSQCAVAEAGEVWRSVPDFRALDARVTCSHCGFNQKADYTPVPQEWNGPAVAFVAHARCPTCGGAWEYPVRFAEAGANRPKSATLACPVGGHEAETALAWVPVRWPQPLDPMFGLPLWLQEPCCGQTLWAFNRDHAAELRSYIAADLRERAFNGKWSMVARLPKWMVVAKNRAAVVRALDRLRAKAASSGCS